MRRFYDELAINDLRKQEDYPVIFNLGISADTSKDIVKRFENEAAARRSREMVIVFCVSTNNAMVTGNDSWKGTDGYRQDLKKLISQARAFTTKVMFVGLPPCEEDKTTPVFWGNYNCTNERILAVDTVMKEVATINKLSHVAIFEMMKNDTEQGKQLFADGLHPNDVGHQLIFEQVRPELDKLLAV